MASDGYEQFSGVGPGGLRSEGGGQRRSILAAIRLVFVTDSVGFSNSKASRPNELLHLSCISPEDFPSLIPAIPVN